MRALLSLPPSTSPGHWNDQSNWARLLPPGRPDSFHIAFFSQHLSTLAPEAQICMLGSTPELRDLCVELGQPSVTVIERSERFHRAVGGLIIRPNPRENVIFGDWLDVLPTRRSCFDAVLSDLTLGNIPYAQRPEFFAAITASLNPGGIFLDKVLTHPYPLRSLASLDEKYSRAPFNLQTVNDFANDYFFVSELVASGVVDIAAFSRILTCRFTDRPRHLRLLAEAIHLVTPRGVWYYGRPWSVVRTAYAPALAQLGCIPEPSPSVFAGWLTLRALRRQGP